MGGAGTAHELRVLRDLRRSGAPDPSVPQHIKVSVLAEQLHMSKRKAIDALDWLERRGAIVIDSRDARGTRTLHVAPGACLCH